MKKIIIVIVSIYFIIGIAYGVNTEMRLAKKYIGNYNSMFKSPYSYVRIVVFSPFWPLRLAIVISNGCSPLGCPVKSIWE